MYGYVRPDVPELKVREKQRYDAWYCGLCRSIGRRYSLLPRLAISYDAAFLAMLVSDISGRASPCERHICPVRALGAKRTMVCIDNPALDYAADVCIILAEFKLKDDKRDGRRLRGAAAAPLHGAFKKARKYAPELYSTVREGIERLNAIEQAREKSLDIAANAFGELMRGVMRLAPLDEALDKGSADKQRAVLSELGYWLGRTVYFLDAWDDREEDERRGTYNPFLLTGADLEDAEFEIVFSINSAISAYNLLPRGEGADGAAVQNVFHLGLFSVWDRVSGGESKSKSKRKKKRAMNTVKTKEIKTDERMENAE